MPAMNRSACPGTIAQNAGLPRRALLQSQRFV